MVKLTIDNKTYEMPEVLSIETWAELIKWDFEDTKYWPRIIGTAINCNPLLLQNVEYGSQELAIVFIATAMQRRKEVKCKDFNTLTFGEFVDLDVYLTYGVDKHMLDIMEILDAKCQDSAEAMWLIDKYTEFRMYTYRSYSALFGTEEASEASGPVDPMQVAKSWYKIIVNLANENLLNIDAVTDQPLKKVLNFMALQKEKQLEEQQRILKQRRQHDLQANRR